MVLLLQVIVALVRDPFRKLDCAEQFTGHFVRDSDSVLDSTKIDGANWVAGRVIELESA